MLLLSKLFKISYLIKLTFLLEKLQIQEIKELTFLIKPSNLKKFE